MKYFLLIIMVSLTLMVVTNLIGQVPVWDDTVVTELSGSGVQKSITQRSIQVGSDNTIHVIYYENTVDGWELFYTYRDNTDTWSVPELIPVVPDRIYNIALILDPDQNDMKIYGTYNNDLYELSRDDFGYWIQEQIQIGTVEITNIDATVDMLGNTHIVGISGNVDNEPKLVYVTNYNGVWEHNVMMDSLLGPFGFGASPNIVTTPDGIVLISYRGGDYMAYNVHLAQNEIAGEFTWNYEVITTPSLETYDSNLKIVGNTVHLTLSGQDGWGFPWSTYYTHRDLDGMIWSTPELVRGALSLLDPTMVVDHEGNIHVVMTEIDGNFATGYIHYSTNSSGSWVLSNPFLNQGWENPTLLLDLAGNFQLLTLFIGFDGGAQWNLIHKGAPFEMLLPVPLNLVAAIDGFNVNLNWESPDIPGDMPDLTIEGYNVWRQSDIEDPFEQINVDLVTDTEYQEINLLPGTYSYYVTAVFEDEGESNPSNIVEITLMEQLPVPEFDPPAGVYDNLVEVTITSPNGVGTIYYTLDGEDPTEESPVYENPFFLDETTTVKARTYHPDWQPSEIAVAEYIVNPTSVDDDVLTVKETKLHSARPNPFNPSTVISYSLHETTSVNITIYNIMGQKVRVLVNEVKEAGTHSIQWNGKDNSGSYAPSGVYFYRMKTSTDSFINKMMLLK